MRPSPSGVTSGPVSAVAGVGPSNNVSLIYVPSLLRRGGEFSITTGGDYWVTADRRVWAMVNRTFRAGYNRNRIRRVMQLHGLMLTPRVHRRDGRPHLGQIQQPASNQRWCSDVFLLPCWSGEVISVAFAIDCHDRELLAYVASPRPLTGADIRTLMDRALWARFGEATLRAPHAIQWLSDNGPQ